MADNGIAKFVDLMRGLIREEIDKTDSTIVCKVVAKNRIDTHEYRYDLCIEPDENNTIKNIQNASNTDIVPGDYVYVYKINNQLNNCFIFKKIGGAGASSYISILEDKISTMVTRDDFSTSITQTAEEISLKASKEDVESEISQKADEIYAQVVKNTDSNGTTGFGWSITVEDGFRVYRTENNTEINIINATAGGLTVTGEINATTGYIGNGGDGFKINNTYIVNGSFTSYDDNEPTHDGVYIGTDGIRLGQAFKVDKYGNVVASTLKTIASVAVKYGISANVSTMPTTWVDSMSSLTPQDGDCVWTWRHTVYTTYTGESQDTDDEYTVSRVGKDGTSVEIKGTVANYTALSAIIGMHAGNGYIVQDASDDTSLPSGAATDGVLYTYDGTNWAYCGQIKGPQGETGYSIVTSLTRLNMSDSDWTTRYQDTNAYTWVNTSGVRNGCRIGDLFTVTGTSNDTGKGYTLTYTSTTASGNLTGICTAYSIAENGENGNGIANVVIAYAESDQGTVPPQIPEADWGDSIPDVDPGNYLWTRTTIVYSDDVTPNTVSYNVSLYGEEGPQGYSIVTSIQQNNLTESDWNTYGTIDREQEWANTSASRNGCRIGDLFTVVGCATDSGRGHTITYRSKTDSGNLKGDCIAHQSTDKGATGNGVTGSIISWALSNQATVPSQIPDTDWSNTIPSPLVQGQYLWTRTQPTTNDDDTTATPPVYVMSPTYTVAYIAEDGSLEELTFSNVCTALGITEDPDDNGIYYGDNNELLISATAIQSGLLQVGTSPNIKFLANMNSDVVNIGGFTVTDTSIQYGTEDVDGSIILNTRARLHAYRSTNNGVNNSQSIMCFTYNGPATDLTVYIRSYAESNSDYTIISLPNSAAIPVSYTSGYTLEHTRGHQKSGHALSDYTAVQYSFLPNTEYKIYVVFVKDISQHSNDDRGYVLIPENGYITIDLAPDTTGATFNPSKTINKYPFELYESYSLSDPLVIAPHFKLGTGFRVDGTGALSIGAGFAVSSLGDVSINGGSITLGTHGEFTVTAAGGVKVQTLEAYALYPTRVDCQTLMVGQVELYGNLNMPTLGSKVQFTRCSFSEGGTSTTTTEQYRFDWSFDHEDIDGSHRYRTMYFNVYAKKYNGSTYTVSPLPTGQALSVAVEIAYTDKRGKNLVQRAFTTFTDSVETNVVAMTFEVTDAMFVAPEGVCSPASKTWEVSTSTKYIQAGLPTSTSSYSSFRSTRDNKDDLGASSQRWKVVYAGTGTINTSDRNEKNTINYNMDKYDGLFDTLKPASFKYNDGTSNRTHLGFISQDIEESLSAVGLTSLDFAGFIKSPALDSNEQEIPDTYQYGLRYNEFHAMEVYEIQKLKHRVAELEQQIIDLTNNDEVKGDEET